MVTELVDRWRSYPYTEKTVLRIYVRQTDKEVLLADGNV